MVASFVELHRSGELQNRADAALQRLQRCDICPRACGVDRLATAGRKGPAGRARRRGTVGPAGRAAQSDRLANEREVCNTGRQARITSVGPHFGEESPLVGNRGSGTIFFCGCNLKCIFCQNADISHGSSGREVDATELAEAMLTIQRLGCHNLNLVTPTHVTAQLLEALCLAAAEGLNIPIVYNCGGYESLDTLALLDGVVDIYMPDLKYGDAEIGLRYSGAKNYPSIAKAAVREMHRQVGDLRIDDVGIARRGLLVRHLVLPNRLAGTHELMRFIADEISPSTYVNVMDQYRPCGYIAQRDPLVGRSISAAEYAEAVQAAQQAGLTRLDNRQRIR